MQAKITYAFNADIWKSEGDGGWYFVSMPEALSTEIRGALQWQEEGWGRMKASASKGDIEWDTALWYDKKRGTYLLPIKASIRSKMGLKVGDRVDVRVII